MQLLVLLLVAALDGKPQDDVKSPEVHPDGRVTFRLRASKAAQVSIAGEWTHPIPNTAQPLTRDARGLWSITVGPLEPNIYIYVFYVDGMTITDPINPLVKLRAFTSASMVEVPGGKPWEPRPVPHGAVEILNHDSAVVKAPRQVFVYTPPGYQEGRARYPVMYLFHGTNDLAAGWTMCGRANQILDNFIADRKAVPMIVVMPWGHALPFASREPGNNDLFEDYLMKEVVPLVEGKYRVAAGRRNHAVVGLSMGGAQALQIGLHHRDRFATIGVFGSGMNKTAFAEKFPKLEGEALDLVYIGVGKEDGARTRAKELSEALGERGIANTFQEVEGGHTYPTWRTLLVETAPLLFRKRAH